MDLRQRRPFYDYKSSFWPLAEMILVNKGVTGSSEGQLRQRHCAAALTALRLSALRHSLGVNDTRHVSMLGNYSCQQCVSPVCILYLVVRRRMLDNVYIFCRVFSLISTAKQSVVFLQTRIKGTTSILFQIPPTAKIIKNIEVIRT